MKKHKKKKTLVARTHTHKKYKAEEKKNEKPNRQFTVCANAQKKD